MAYIDFFPTERFTNEYSNPDSEIDDIMSGLKNGPWAPFSGDTVMFNFSDTVPTSTKLESVDLTARVGEAEEYLQDNHDGYSVASCCVVLDYWYPDGQSAKGIVNRVCGNRKDGQKTTIVDFKAVVDERDFGNISDRQAQIRYVAHEAAHVFCGRHKHGNMKTPLFSNNRSL